MNSRASRRINAPAAAEPSKRRRRPSTNLDPDTKQGQKRPDSGKDKPMLNKVAFTMYPVEDMPRARAFYEETLGLGPSRNGATSPWVEFDLPGGGCLPSPTSPATSRGRTAPPSPSRWTTCRPRSPISRARASPSRPRTSSPVCRMAVCLDSEGNAIILHKLKTAEERAQKVAEALAALEARGEASIRDGMARYGIPPGPRDRRARVGHPAGRRTARPRPCARRRALGNRVFTRRGC